MKSHSYAIALFVGILIFPACSTVKVVTDTREGQDFAKYQTFKVVHFVNEEDQKASKFRMNSINRDRIKDAIVANAEARGMKNVESDPDVYLLWATDIDIEKSYASHTTYSGGPYMGYRGRYYNAGPSYTSTQEYENYVGILTIAIAKPDQEKVLWYGRGEKSVSGDGSKAKENIDLVVGKIMEEFPVGKTE